MARFPDGKRFAFSVFDDTDNGTVANLAPVYGLLRDLGFRTTKSVWPLPSVPEGRIGGASLADADYLEFVRQLQRDGFEIALHNVRNHDATREQVVEGIDCFAELLGGDPQIHCNHSTNRENIYWGADRLSTPWIRLVFSIVTCLKRRERFLGHVEHSPYFWGEICRQRIGYVRNLTFNEINLDNVNPTMPYHDPHKPYVNRWFSSCEGANVEAFCKMISEQNQDRLAAEGGVCIMYTHFGSGFVDDDGVLNPQFQELMKRLATLGGWYVPVTELLDHLQAGRDDDTIPRSELAAMERRWLKDKLW